MREKRFLTVFQPAVLFIILCYIINAFEGCSNKESQNSKGNISTSSSELNKNEKQEVISDSSVIYILSPDGVVLKKIKYLPEQSGEDSPNKDPEYENYIRGYPESDTISGDFDGDFIQEKAWFENRGFEVFEDCRATGNKKSCEGIIRFSDITIRPLTIDYCPMWIFKNEGDLNSDGKDEIGVLPGWFSSGCRNYEVFTYKNNRWIESCPPISNTYNMREAGIVPIEIDSGSTASAVIRVSIDSYISANPQNKIPAEYLQGSSCSTGNVVEYSIKLK